MREALQDLWTSLSSIPHAAQILAAAYLTYLLVLACYIVLQKREPVATLSWILSLAALPYLHPGRSVDRDLKRHFADPRVRLAFSFQTKYLGMSPFRCPSLFTILSFLEYEHGVYHPVGGCGAISEAMAGLCRRMGVDIRLGTSVERVTFDGKRADTPEIRTEYHSDGTPYMMKTMVLGAAPAKLPSSATRMKVRIASSWFIVASVQTVRSLLSSI